MLLRLTPGFMDLLIHRSSALIGSGLVDREPIVRRTGTWAERPGASPAPARVPLRPLPLLLSGSPARNLHIPCIYDDRSEGGKQIGLAIHNRFEPARTEPEGMGDW